jgi:hypothetical protein
MVKMDFKKIFFIFFLLVILNPLKVYSYNQVELDRHIAQVLQNNPIKRSISAEFSGHERMVDALFERPSLCAKLANLWSPEKFRITDYGKTFELVYGRHTSGLVYKVEQDFINNRLVYFFDGLHQGRLIKAKMKMFMEIKYSQQGADRVIIEPHASIRLENLFLQKMAHLMLKIPLIRSYINRRIDEEISVIKNLGVLVIENLISPEGYEQFLELSRKKVKISPREYEILDQLFLNWQR